jgi:cyclic beta-1,2-glucan synthetase
MKKFINDFDDITEYYNFLVNKTKNHQYVEITNEWLIDNYYLLVEHKNNILNFKKDIKKSLKVINKEYFILKAIVSKQNYNVDFKYLTEELRKYQKENDDILTYREIANIIPTLVFIYTERLNNLCRDEYNKLVDKEEVEEIIKNNEEINLNLFINSKFDLSSNGYYIFEVNNQLRKSSKNNNDIFIKLNEYLKEHDISLKEIINDEYQKKLENNILISNIFSNFKEFFEFSTEDLFEKVSYTEKLLLQDSVYKSMTIESKKEYRNELLHLAKKNHTNEYKYLQSIFDKEEHIGYKLFKQKSKTPKVVIYIAIIFIITAILAYYLSDHFIKFRLLGFLILLIPISQLLIQIINEFLIKFEPTKVIPKLDYSKGIPAESRTMVVIPTIVSTEEKIKDMFDTLESFYLVNKSDNLYFTLLGDVKAGQEKIMPFDKDISKFGQEYAENLNKKYKKDIFFFIYRKRIWNKKEDCYLGYERKRGALLQFNKILLGESLDENKYFNVNMLHNNNLNIKYVITLDTDTKLVLNSALNLVGAMAHPLNKPILNKQNTKVISGYGLMQPRVSVDIEATNKSLYSQIFAGIGGFDTYSAVVPNVYQDTFGEGSFVGKGIYDLKIFNQLLEKTFPDNLILSHDLLEGNYLRCGYVSDIELIDDFPSKFLTDVTRHHRWARGDTQIIGWLLNKVPNKENKNVKNPINILGKYKILDNIVRMFLNPMLLLILLLSFTGSIKKSIFWILFVALEIAISIIFFLRSKMYRKKKERKEIYYKNLYSGGKSILLRSYIVFATIPYYTKLYMDAFFRTLYRLFYSHKNLLNWITAEEVEKTVDGSLKNYIKNFTFNIFVAIVFVIIGLVTKNYLAFPIAFIFLSAPFVLYLVSKDIDHYQIELKDKQVDEIKELAKRTWKYFEDNLKEEYNYLIPDNYQENREEKLDIRTSPTSIGFSLTSIVSAYELDFITKEHAEDLLEKILTSIDSLKKWHGHLYNWYDIRTKKVLYPNFVSTVDSGNLVACLIVTREFLNKLENEKLVKLCDKLIKNSNFKKLYSKRDVFSIGYDEDEGRLSIYNYNKFASESRLTSYLSICLGDAPSKHWFCLDKSLTTHKGRKGLISWSGTAFEYFMPGLFMKNYPNTLLDETYHFAVMCQKDYINTVSHKLPWGISESAYDELDNSLNYKYKAFSTPYLKAKEDKESRIVISPYSSLMAMDLFPEDVYENIKKLKELDMYSDYGFYESYDYDTKGVVKSYFAHHEGMSLLGITNYLKSGIIKKLFHSNVNIRTFEILLKEKVQIKTSIDMKMAKYKKYDYNKERIENDIRAFDYISYLPEMSVLSNRKYSLIMNDRGNSFSRYRTTQLNRYRKVTELDYGIFMFVKDTNTKYIWSNTYAPMNIKPDKYEVIFAADKIKFLRRDGGISTKTEIVVTRNYHAEIRKVTFKNEDDIDKELEITTYTEPIISENMDDVSHRVFNNMFISTEYDKKTNSLIAKRKSRGDSTVNSYMFTRLIIKEPVEEYSYETERDNFIGRNRLINNAISLDKELTNYAGDNLDPVLSQRNKVKVPASSSVTVYLLVGFGRSKEQIKDIINHYSTKNILEKEFSISTLMNVIETKNLNITGENMRTYNIMLNYLYQTTRISVNEERMDYLRKNALGQSGLWKFGVSGDRPIISVEINDISDMSFIYEILKAFEYYKNKSIFVDIIIINNESQEYAKVIKKEIDAEMYRIYTLNSFYHTPGSVTVINSENITREDRSLLNMVPRLHFNIENHISLKEAVEELQRKNKINDYPTYPMEENIEVKEKEKLSFDNGFGGFKANGKEYVIYNKDTPTPWSNVIANKNFGTIVTNNGCGYTYAYNSGEFKITSWTNEMVVNDKSEGFKLNGKMFDPEKCIHGFGYSILESETEDLKHEITEFVAENENIKIYLMKLKNKNKKKTTTNVEFWLNPTFGNFEEKTTRHILTEFMGDDNYLKMRNVYSINYGDVNVFMSSSEKITSAECEKMLIKSISFDVDLAAQEEKEIVFMLGCSQSEDENLDLIGKYSDIDVCHKELKNVKDYWHKTLTRVQVDTPDNSFDFVINGWYLYQTLSARIMAKAGFYQVSGAFGYRDQLQDAMNIALVKPEYTREQILINAAHQFSEGDVLHWWHEKNHFGLRSRYKDDYLWLVYATVTYIKITGDYDILNEEVPYVLGESLSDYEHEKGIVFNYTDSKATLLEHCLKSLELSMNSLGQHKIPLMGGGDWNDGMNRVGIKGKGESVWLGFFLYNVIDLFTKTIKKYDKNFDTTKYLKFNEELKENLNKKTWDGSYYLRAFFDNGDKLGSHENSECKIDLISQSFSILSGVAPKDRVQSVITSVEEQLVDKDKKIIKLLTPAFSKSLNNPGYIMNYPKGIRENGGQYTHSVSWYLMALIKAGYHDRAYRYYQMINPINRSRKKDDVETYRVEPYVIAADIYSSENFPARGGWTWYTGSAGWFYRVGVENIIGLQKNGDKLKLNPKMPIAWDGFKVTYHYENTTYNIEVIKTTKEKLLIDKKEVIGTTIDLVDDKKVHEVKLYIK